MSYGDISAFPQPCSANGYESNNPFIKADAGLSIREYFAGQALMGLLSCPQSWLVNWPPEDKKSHEEFIARLAFKFADAMCNEAIKQKGE